MGIFWKILLGVIAVVILMNAPAEAGQAVGWFFHQLGVFFGALVDILLPDLALAEPAPPAQTVPPTVEPSPAPTVHPEPQATKTVYVYPDGHREEGK
jgi:hypothetical protein